MRSAIGLSLLAYAAAKDCASGLCSDGKDWNVKGQPTDADCTHTNAVDGTICCPNGDISPEQDILAHSDCGKCPQYQVGLQAQHWTGGRAIQDNANCNDNAGIWMGGNGKDSDGNDFDFGSEGVKTTKTCDSGLCSEDKDWTVTPVTDYIAGNCEKGDLTGKCGPVHLITFEKGNMLLEFNHEEDASMICEGGMFLPFIPGEMMWGKTAHIVIYFFLMIFSFLGIAIIADVFMAAIEVITSKEKTITITENGKEKTITYLVWNATVANLTLMALGSSAPEILLSVIETIGTLNQTADPGGLGPGTIVGSAAFNLLVIIAICVMAINGKKEDGSPDTRKIEEMGVFTITAVYSVLAYVWLFLCVRDNTVQLYEAVITFLLFPLLVIHCYLADQKKLPYFLGGGRKDTASTQHVVGTSGMGAQGYGAGGDLEKQIAKLDAVKMASNLAKADASTMSNFSSSPDGSGLSGSEAAMQNAQQQIANMAVQEHLAKKKPSIAQSKINARRQLAGRQRVVVKKTAMSSGLKTMKEDAAAKASCGSASTAEDKTFVSFSCHKYSVQESAGKVAVTIECNRSAKDDKATIYCTATTQDGTALSGEDYVHKRFDLSFAPGESEKIIEVELIDDTEYEPDETFVIKLTPGKTGRKGKESECEFDFFPAKITTVVIINDDCPGTFGFSEPTNSIGEKGVDGKGYAEVTVKRENGSDGEITIKYKTVDGSAVAGDDYEPAIGELVFKHQEVEKTIKVGIIESSEYEKSETFTVELEIPGAPANGAKVGENQAVIVTILGDEDSAKVVNEVAQLMKLQLDKLSLNTTSWGQQFDEAMSIQGEEGESPATMDYVMHCATFGWKVLFAIVPPTCYKDGWVTFFVALAFVGLLTAFVADIAGIFGCLLGLQDSITAITFVALGTSLPDTFASKTAAVNDDSADASVGNVTGSNSVNVFLGLGLPWLMATIIHTISDFKSDAVLSKGKIVTFEAGGYPMIAGSLGFSVVLFCICAITCIAGLYVRRFTLGHELGGNPAARDATGAFFICLWMIYIVVSSLEVEGHIESFI